MTESESNKNLQDKFVQANPSPVLSSGSDGVLQFVNPAASELMRELELEMYDDMLPADHKGLVKACLKIGVTLTGKRVLAGRTLAWSYKSSEEESETVYIYGHDISEYTSAGTAINVLPKANPNPVISSTVEGVLKFTNPAVSKLLKDLQLVDAADVLPLDHKGLLQACAATKAPLTEERDVDGRILIWTYKSFGDSDDIFIFGHDLINCSSKMFCTGDIPNENPSPVLSMDVEGEAKFINGATFEMLEELGLDKVENILPADHKGMVKACHVTNTPLTKQHQVAGKTIIWSYHPVDGSDVIYIYGHEITDYLSNISSGKS